ncbi:TIGR03086 family protein [Saccharopolyspora shandongensis]|uniref:TIGR03086 family protein n=1 Tax=Saccharopolyspora shandongensis TaxID=418495 RepID=A0A1H3CTL8_9PSEU|nr:TIGR03086 family protein [Saccharopolyspora shandongensis]
MINFLDGVVDRFVLSSAEFERTLRSVQPEQWSLPTPCTEWNVRQLVNHMTRGNLNYVSLLSGGTSAEFLRMRDVDALGTDPVGAYARSAQACGEAFGRPGALRQVLDYPLGQVTGQQALAVRTTDATIHTWDLAQALGVDDDLNPDLVGWINDHLEEIYAGLAETPVAIETTHRFFAAPEGALTQGASKQDRLLHRLGRKPQRDR